MVKTGPRQAQPGHGRLGAQAQGLGIAGQGDLPIVGTLRLLGLRQPAIETGRDRPGPGGDLGRLAPRLLGIAPGEETQFRQAAGLALLGRRLTDRDVTRDGVGEGAGVLEFALEEAPAGLAVVGEGPAAPIGEAGRLAGIQVDVLAGLQVATEIVHAFHHHQLAPGGFARRGGKG